MQWLFGLFMVLISASATAQPQGMSQADMQKMMQQAQAMQACMANVDQASLKALEKKGRKLEAKIKQLCADGQRDKAMATAMQAGMEISQDPLLKDMKKCTEMMPTMLSDMMTDIPFSDSQNDKGKSGKHICD
ncbi:MAG: hypothetical protein KUG71_00825 [Porticoccaceae bacterium]|nr:hypothetical protein [Porticoccaceae bacterium]